MQIKNHIRPALVLLLGGAIQAFGLYNIHSISGVAEGGIFGLTLLLKHWLDLSPAISGFFLNAACYLFGWRTMGRQFIWYSAVAGLGFSGFYAFFEQFPPLWPEIAQHPFLAALAGAVFIGVGAGLCVRIGGAPSGDDALAMGIRDLTKVDIRWIYLVSDLSVLLLSITYIPLRKWFFSVLTAVLSGQILGIVVKFQMPHHIKAKKKEQDP